MSWWNKTNPKQTSSSTTPAVGGGNLRISIGGLDNKYHTPLYILITITLFTILSIIILSIRFALTGAVGNEGNATLTNVSIKQAGTGQSVVIRGETLDEITLNQETGYGTDDASRRIILNNNVVRYEATYNVTSPGIIELSITLPANNTVDEATIGSAQQCMNGSKLESADITNSDGTITKSYTNNKATCIRNITSPGSTNWNITAYPWGSNNEQITPTLAINNQAQATKPEPITVVGRPNYGIDVFRQFEIPGNSQYTQAIHFGVALYTSPQDSLLGVAPIDNGDWSATIDVGELPSGWIVAESANTPNGRISSVGLTDTSIAHSGAISLVNRDSLITVNMSDAATAVRHCPKTVGVAGMSTDKCYYSGFEIVIGVPYASLSDGYEHYALGFGNIKALANGVEYTIIPQPSRLSWTLSSRASAQYAAWALSNEQDLIAPVGWLDQYTQNQPVYSGESFYSMLMMISNVVPGQESATNLNICLTFDPNELNVHKQFVRNTTNAAILTSNPNVQYGVSTSNICTDAGYDADSFFDTLDEASIYASQAGRKVNAVRIHADTVAAWQRDGRIGSLGVAVIARKPTREVTNVLISTSASTSEWSEIVGDMTVTLTPGLLSHTLTAEPSSTNPGKEDHITITTKTYNKDTNAKITVNLPTGLSIKPGTITIKDPNTGSPIPLIEGETSDYTVSLNATNATATTTTPTSSTTSDDTNPTNTTKLTNGSTITFNLDNIATNHGINLTGYEPIYPGESGVTNIECNATSNTASSTASNATSNSDTNPTCHEVITTNNNNTDDDPINDDLPIAADNNGNGIEHTHTPIEFDVVIDEDTPAPSTITINSTASGTGTDYASSTFKSASDTIAVADPPRTFGYGLTTSSNYVYAGDNLTYNYQVSNLTNNEVTNLDLVTVLPYNDDSRGTTGLIDPATPATNPYTLTNLTTSLPDGAHLYYTIDTTAVRQIEQGKDTSALISDPSIIWQELDSNTIPTDIASKITALRLSIDNFAMDSKANFSITLTNILANNPTTDLQPSLVSDITYLGYQAAGIPALTSHTNLVKTSYEGNLLVLNPDKTTITTNLNPNEAKLGNGNVDNPDSLTNRLDITARTLNGYTVTMQVKGNSNSLLPVSINNASNANNTNNTNDNTNRLIPAINTTPTAGLTGWAISLDTTNADPAWQAVPAIDSDTDQPTLPLAIYQTDGNGPKSLRLPIAYGVSTSQNTIADTYRAEVVYTLTAEP